MKDVTRRALDAMASDARKAALGKRVPRDKQPRDFMISIGLASPDDHASDEMPEQEGAGHEGSEGARGMDAGVDTRPRITVEDDEDDEI